MFAQLREQGVTYINKLGRFIGPNQLEVEDKKGKKEVISSARFVVAVGGRPTPIDCPGGELAISSDDLFSLVSVFALTSCFSLLTSLRYV